MSDLGVGPGCSQTEMGPLDWDVMCEKFDRREFVGMIQDEILPGMATIMRSLLEMACTRTNDKRPRPGHNGGFFFNLAKEMPSLLGMANKKYE